MYCNRWFMECRASMAHALWCTLSFRRSQEESFRYIFPESFLAASVRTPRVGSIHNTLHSCVVHGSTLLHLRSQPLYLQPWKQDLCRDAMLYRFKILLGSTASEE